MLEFPIAVEHDLKLHFPFRLLGERRGVFHAVDRLPDDRADPCVDSARVSVHGRSVRDGT